MCRTAIALVVSSALGTALSVKTLAGAPGQTVTPVSGPSWVHTLGVDYGETSLGRGSGRYGPSPSDLATVRKAAEAILADTVTVTGEDLYRLNCQACHRAEGTGAPPEIKSILPAVQGSTLAHLRINVKRDDLYTRIEKGGQKMPARGHLQAADVDVLYAYLKQLAKSGDNSTGRAAQETMSADRLGENVVKGTCHICHDATGPQPGGRAMLEGAIPSLASIMADTSIVEFVNKAERGAVTVMGAPPMPHRGRMPVFYYLTDRELAAAYHYLHRHPPQP